MLTAEKLDIGQDLFNVRKGSLDRRRLEELQRLHRQKEQAGDTRGAKFLVPEIERLQRELGDLEPRSHGSDARSSSGARKRLCDAMNSTDALLRSQSKAALSSILEIHSFTIEV